MEPQRHRDTEGQPSAEHADKGDSDTPRYLESARLSLVNRHPGEYVIDITDLREITVVRTIAKDASTKDALAKDEPTMGDVLARASRFSPD